MTVMTQATPFQQAQNLLDQKLGPDGATFIFRPHPTQPDEHIFVINRGLHGLNLQALAHLPAELTHRVEHNLLRLQGPPDRILQVLVACCT